MSKETAIRSTYFSIIWNILLALIKRLVWFFGNSYALIADAIESTNDVFSSCMVLFWIHYSHKPADAQHPYGYWKAEALTTFAVVAFLIISALIIAHDSIKNLMTPHELPKAYTLFVLWWIIIWKEISYRIVLQKSIETNSSSLRADAWHHRSDAITSVAAFIWITIALIGWKWYEYADDVAALWAAWFILYNSYLIFRPAFGEMMDEHVYDDLVEEIRLVSANVPWILDTEKCHIRKAWTHYYVDLHAIVHDNISVKQWHDIAHLLKDTIIEKVPLIANVLVHVEPFEEQLSYKTT